MTYKELMRLKKGSKVYRVEQPYNRETRSHGPLQVTVATVLRLADLTSWRAERYVLSNGRMRPHELERGWAVSAKRALATFEKRERQYLRWSQESMAQHRMLLRKAARLRKQI